MDDRSRTPLLVAGLAGVAVVAVLASFVHGVVGGEDEAPLRVADVEGTWTAEDDSRARLLIRADGSAEVSGEAQAKGCAVVMWSDGRSVEATWVFGDVDEPRTVHVDLPGHETVPPCSVDLVVKDSGIRASSSARAGAVPARWIRGPAPR
ncbi:hypothetical protein OHA37_15560 [Streptomyces sp. NBC_00335]|uniref:hypothetical protein n=1 Tax=unclassified Streptomyces TaxID=2593676 RepID=UPI002256FDFF|nr:MULTISPECIES: hypothetical protein [unclassified Streptomyces]MCX5405298.1 hypothetical protein [Streptomyces sp. NBC_00086]